MTHTPRRLLYSFFSTNPTYGGGDGTYTRGAVRYTGEYGTLCVLLLVFVLVLVLVLLLSLIPVQSIPFHPVPSPHVLGAPRPRPRPRHHEFTYTQTSSPRTHAVGVPVCHAPDQQKATGTADGGCHCHGQSSQDKPAYRASRHSPDASSGGIFLRASSGFGRAIVGYRHGGAAQVFSPG